MSKYYRYWNQNRTESEHTNYKKYNISFYFMYFVHFCIKLNGDTIETFLFRTLFFLNIHFFTQFVRYDKIISKICFHK